MSHFTEEYHKFFTGLANKDFYVMANLKSDDITNSKLPEKLMEYYFAVKPLQVFFTKTIM